MIFNEQQPKNIACRQTESNMKKKKKEEKTHTERSSLSVFRIICVCVIKRKQREHDCAYKRIENVAYSVNYRQVTCNTWYTLSTFIALNTMCVRILSRRYRCQEENAK